MRYLATGFLVHRVHILCFKYEDDRIQVISFRKADEREVREYERRRRIWNKGPDLIDDDGEVRELTANDFARMKPFSSLPEDSQHKLREIQRGNVTFRPDEEKVPVPVSKSVVEGFRASGDDWQGRVDQVLREWLEQHQAS